MVPGAYVAGDSFLHRADPRVKVVATIVLMVGAMTLASPAQTLLAVAATCALCASARINPLSLLRSTLPVILGLAVVALLNVFVVRTGTPVFEAGPVLVTTDGLATAGAFCAKVAILVLQGSLLLATTTPTRLTRAFSSLLAPLKKIGVPVDELALVMSIGLRFIPTLGTEVRQVREAQASRGSTLAKGGPVKRLRALAAILVPVLAATLRHAEGLSLALEARSWVAGEPRTVWHRPHVRPSDVVYLAGCIAYVVALFML
jgi:energy-coupling factor transport system ATP-binding protein